MNYELAPYAVDLRQSRGRRVAEAPPAWRSEFQRDRDRVIHSSAFRRLEYKTQVFVNHEGDMFRTRLTHSLEVAQIARTIARALCLNEDLTEAIALAHDLGHTPFGHAGQTALNGCMQPYGGFEHNFHSLRVVDELEQRYASFDGLNLLFETREGILKHCSVARAASLGPLGARFLDRRQPSLEAQIANVADEIAYNHHDIDDGLRSDILSLETVCEHSGFRDALAASREQAPALSGKRLTYTAIRHMLGAFVADLIDATRERLASRAPLSVDASVRCIAERAQSLVIQLFEAFMADPALLPATTATADKTDPQLQARVIADYIAGMTDRYALAEHSRVFGVEYALAPPSWPQA